MADARKADARKAEIKKADANRQKPTLSNYSGVEVLDFVSGIVLFSNCCVLKVGLGET